MKPWKNLLPLFLICSVQLVISVSRLLMDDSGLPSSGFIYFMCTVIFIGLLVVLLIDLVIPAVTTYQGKIVLIEGKIIHLLRDDRKLKKYKISVPEVLDRLAEKQRVEIQCTKLAHIPSRIKLL